MRKFSQFFAFFFAKQIEAKFCKKKLKFSHCSFGSNANCEIFSKKMFVGEKLETIFPFGHVDSED